MPAAFQFTLCSYSIDALVVDDTPIVLEKGSVLACHIHQHRRETIRTATVDRSAVWIGACLCPQGWFRTSGIAMTRTTGIACIDRSQPATVAISAGTCIVIELVATDESSFQVTRHPVGFRVVGNRRTAVNGGCSCRQGVTLGNSQIALAYAFVIRTANDGHYYDRRQHHFQIVSHTYHFLLFFVAFDIMTQE